MSFCIVWQRFCFIFSVCKSTNFTLILTKLNKNIMTGRISILFLGVLLAVISGCSTAYKSTQTPDDVYYSPSRDITEERVSQRKEEIRDYSMGDEDREILMGIRSRRWRYINDPFYYGWNNGFYNTYDYFGSPYNYCFNNWSGYYGYYYNPYYYPYPIYNPVIIVTKPTRPVTTTPRMVNLNAYRGYNRVNIPSKSDNNNKWNNTYRSYNNSNRSGSRVGNVIREILTPSTPSSNNSDNNSSRSYNPSSGSSNSGQSNGSNGGSISRPSRGQQ